MISLAEIDSLVRSGESETLEFKRTTGERREAVRTICAMLNHRGGELKNELAQLKHLGLVNTTGYARGARWMSS